MQIHKRLAIWVAPALVAVMAIVLLVRDPAASGAGSELGTVTASAVNEAAGGRLKLSACAFALGVTAASYFGLPVNPLGSYAGVIVGVCLLSLFC
jgi:hypothetical protein